MKKEVKCPKCKYSWETESDKLFVCCPNCMRKFPNPNKRKAGAG